jgi:dTDP-4-amino-4,6-dideoxygalactose transaminase
MKIPISRPLFGPEERQALLEPLETGWVVQGPRVAEFESRFAEFTHARQAVATTSCTSALHLALASLGVGRGDEVIVPAFTWIATANVVEQLGARPVFVDIDLETFNIDVRQLRHALTPRTRLLLPVSLFGLSADMYPILDLARQHNLVVVEDAACAIGAWYHGHHAGTLADAGCFSFHPRKSITTGEGGMLTTARLDLAETVRSLRDHGASVSDLTRHRQPRSYQLPDFPHAGFNYRMTDFQGALGVVQMTRLPDILERRKALARRFDEELEHLSWLRTPPIPSGCRHGYQAYVCLYCQEEPRLSNVQRLHAGRNALMDRLEAAGIATRPGTHAVHMLDYYRHKYGLRAEDYPNAYLADQLSLAIPLFPQMTDEEQNYIVRALRTNKITRAA